MSETATQNDITTTPETSKWKKPKATTRAAAKKDKAAAPAKPKKTATPPREKKSKVPLCTFAIRLRVEERAEIHRAAGARNATQFVRAVALAAAREDDAAFKNAIADAKKLTT